jgi:hypothetical protein
MVIAVGRVGGPEVEAPEERQVVGDEQVEVSEHAAVAIDCRLVALRRVARDHVLLDDAPGLDPG